MTLAAGYCACFESRAPGVALQASTETTAFLAAQAFTAETPMSLQSKTARWSRELFFVRLNARHT
jgi:hypothetical protein